MIFNPENLNSIIFCYFDNGRRSTECLHNFFAVTKITIFLSLKLLESTMSALLVIAVISVLNPLRHSA